MPGSDLRGSRIERWTSVRVRDLCHNLRSIIHSHNKCLIVLTFDAFQQLHACVHTNIRIELLDQFWFGITEAELTRSSRVTSSADSSIYEGRDLEFAIPHLKVFSFLASAPLLAHVTRKEWRCHTTTDIDCIDRALLLEFLPL